MSLPLACTLTGFHLGGGEGRRGAFAPPWIPSAPPWILTLFCHTAWWLMPPLLNISNTLVCPPLIKCLDETLPHVVELHNTSEIHAQKVKHQRLPDKAQQRPTNNKKLLMGEGGGNERRGNTIRKYRKSNYVWKVSWYLVLL